MTRRIIQTSDTVMEVAWLLALVSIPIYFNIYTSRVFEPDKVSLFRSLVLVMLVAWAAKGLARLAAERIETVRRTKPVEATPIIYPPDGEVIGPDSRPFPLNTLGRPLVAFALALGFVYCLATVFSVTPGVSWWGSFQRQQGAYTLLSYIAFFMVMAFNLRERRQVERLVSFVLLGNIPVALYGLLQHFKADPLPWQGDVVFRVTSTMGNAIFIAAYLIMVVPLLLYRLVTTGLWLVERRATAGRCFQGRQRNNALSWIALYGCFTLFLVGLFFAVLNVNANYRPELGVETTAEPGGPGLVGGDSLAAESRGLVGNEGIGPWWALPLGIMLSFGLFFLFTVRRRGTDNNYLFRLFEFGSYLGLLVIIGLTTLYSQSRGPLAGLIIGLALFFPIIFWRRKARKWLVGWLAAGLVLGLVFIMYNLPPGSTPLEPAFQVARQNSQLARLGQFFQTNDGTGRVRQLIWKTVFEAVGAAAQKEPGRVLVGYGPESLYNVSPRYYQAELAQLEARNAIPDRSHNAYLDALVMTGGLGLAAYLAFVLAFFYYAFKFLRRTERLEYQVLLAALIAMMAAHQVEIQTGIQIVSTWMMFWTGAALLLAVGGLVYGRWDRLGWGAIAAEPVAVEEAVEESEPVLTGKNARKGSKARSGSGAERRKPVLANAATLPDYGPERPVRPWYWAILGTVAVLALAYGWFGNAMPVWADTVYKQGYNLAAVQQWRRATPYLERATLNAPNEDHYALYLGQAYLELAQVQLREAAADKSKPLNQAGVEALLAGSERELQRALRLAPLNPDHYANLARLYTRWAELEPARGPEMLRKAVARYEEVVTNYAPHNAALWAELAAAQANLATNRVDPDISGTAVDRPGLDKATAWGEQSVNIDQQYSFNRLVLGDIYRFAGRVDEAGQQYLKLAELEPRQLNRDERFYRRIRALALSRQITPQQIKTVFDPARARSSGTSSVATEQAFFFLSQGIYFYYKDNLEEARTALNNAAGLAPADPYAHAFLAQLYRRQGQTTPAQNEAAQARDLAGKVQSNPQAARQAVEAILAG